MALLDILFPKRCVGCGRLGGYLCANCFTYITFAERGFCSVCQKAAIGGLTHPVCLKPYGIDGIFASVTYAGVVKRLVYQFKYNPYLTDLRQTLIDLYYEGIIQKEEFCRQLTPGAWLVPVPLHSSRMRQRGYNQSMILARGIVKKCPISNVQYPMSNFKFPISNRNIQIRNGKIITRDRDDKGVVVVDCLERVRRTKPQFGLSQQGRRENIRGAFAIKAVFLKDVKQVPNVFLVDDIVTSGATFAEAAQVLKRAGVGKVWGVAFAHG